MKGNKKNVILIGMPGCGKSTIGVVLAKVLGYEFTDSDLLIQRREGKLLREIIAEQGEDGFRENRERYCADRNGSERGKGASF